MNSITKNFMIMLALGTGMFLFASCGDSDEATPSGSVSETAKEESKEEGPNKGIGPVVSVELGEIDEAMAAAGKVIFDDNCTACHKPEEKYIGPAPKGILEYRTPEWVMNMILNPEEMVQKDPDARKLLAEFIAPMANQNLTEEEARKILEYFRTL